MAAPVFALTSQIFNTETNGRATVRARALSTRRTAKNREA